MGIAAATAGAAGPFRDYGPDGAADAAAESAWDAVALTPTSTAGDRTRFAEVCYTAGLDNAGCATGLRRQAKEERRGPDPSWNR